MSNDSPVFVIYHMQRTATGLRRRYRTRTSYEPFWLWVATQPVVDANEDWPWAYWSFETEEADTKFDALWGKPIHGGVEEDDTMDTPIPVVLVRQPDPVEEVLAQTLMDCINEEIEKEILKDILNAK